MSPGGSSRKGAWARAWVQALKERSPKDRIARARSFLEIGAVVEVSVEPGVIRGVVQGVRGALHAVEIHCKPVDPGLRALLRKRMGPSGLLLEGLCPSGADLHGTCGCSDWAPLCEHAAAVYLAFVEGARKRTADVLLLRGYEFSAGRKGTDRREASAATGSSTTVAHEPASGAEVVPSHQALPATDPLEALSCLRATAAGSTDSDAPPLDARPPDAPPLDAAPLGVAATGFAWQGSTKPSFATRESPTAGTVLPGGPPSPGGRRPSFGLEALRLQVQKASSRKRRTVARESADELLLPFDASSRQAGETPAVADALAEAPTVQPGATTSAPPPHESGPSLMPAPSQLPATDLGGAHPESAAPSQPPATVPGEDHPASAAPSQPPATVPDGADPASSAPSQLPATVPGEDHPASAAPSQPPATIPGEGHPTSAAPSQLPATVTPGKPSADPRQGVGRAPTETTQPPRPTSSPWERFWTGNGLPAASSDRVLEEGLSMLEQLGPPPWSTWEQAKETLAPLWSTVATLATQVRARASRMGDALEDRVAHHHKHATPWLVNPS